MLFMFYLIGQIVCLKVYGILIMNVVYWLKCYWWKIYDICDLLQIDSVVIYYSLIILGNVKVYVRYYVEENGWVGIGYYYVIGKDGSIEQFQFLKIVSNYMSGENICSVGICLMGNYDIQQLFLEQVDVVVKLI